MTIDTKTLRSEAQDYFNAGLYRAGGILVRAADTIDSLTRRLEITDDAPGWDGIACRDETIRGQENVIDAQAAEIARLRKALKDLMVASPSQLACEAFHHNPSDRHADADVCQPVKRYQDALEAARAALQEKSKC